MDSNRIFTFRSHYVRYLAELKKVETTNIRTTTWGDIKTFNLDTHKGKPHPLNSKHLMTKSLYITPKRSFPPFHLQSPSFLFIADKADTPDTPAPAHSHAAHTAAQADTAPANSDNLPDYTHTCVLRPAHYYPFPSVPRVPPSSPPSSATLLRSPFAPSQDSSSPRMARMKTGAMMWCRRKLGTSACLRGDWESVRLRWCCRRRWRRGWDAGGRGIVGGGSSRREVP